MLGAIPCSLLPLPMTHVHRRYFIRCTAPQHLALASTVSLLLPMLLPGSGSSHLQVSPYPSFSCLSPRCYHSQFRAEHFTQCANPWAQERDESTRVPSASLDLLRINSLGSECGQMFDVPTPRQLLGKWQVDGSVYPPTHRPFLARTSHVRWISWVPAQDLCS